jgi:hypothetical protein
MSLLAHSQYHYGKFNYYSGGIKTSYDMYFYEFNKAQNVKHKQLPNFTITATGAYYFTYLIEFHGGLKYSFRNLVMDWKFPTDPNDLFVPDETKYKVAYIGMPLDARINVLYGMYVKTSISLGIMPEFRTRPREIVTYQNDITEENFHTFNTKDFRKFLFAFPVGIHTKINLNRHYTLELSANYLQYVTKFNKTYSKNSAYAFSFSLGFFYDW